MTAYFRRALMAALALAVLAGTARAHDVPNRMDVHAFLKQDGRQVEMVARVPLALLLNVGLPKRGPGYIEIDGVQPDLERAAAAVSKALRLYADDALVDLRVRGVQLAQPSNRAFESFESARSHVNQPLPPPSENIFWNQGYFDVAFGGTLVAPDADLAIEPWIAPGLSGRISLFLRYITEGTVTAYRLDGARERLYLNPGPLRAASTFVGMGMEHIFGGIDHVLFIIAIILPFGLRDFWALAKIVTGFTIAHSVTLSLSALGYVAPGAWFPPVVEAIIALSILYMCLENVFCAGLGRERVGARWVTASLFGLVHGFGFAFVLQEELQFSGGHLALSLAAFNIGVEVGQLIILAVVLPVIAMAFQDSRVRRIGVIVVSALVGHSAWHWTIERFGALQNVQWPAGTTLVAGLAVVFAIAGIIGMWLYKARRPGRASAEEAPLRSWRAD